MMHEKYTFILFPASQRHPAWDICSENDPLKTFISAALYKQMIKREEINIA
jgi:hypothetical protein